MLKREASFQVKEHLHLVARIHVFRRIDLRAEPIDALAVSPDFGQAANGTRYAKIWGRVFHEFEDIQAPRLRRAHHSDLAARKSGLDEASDSVRVPPVGGAVDDVVTGERAGTLIEEPHDDMGVTCGRCTGKILPVMERNRPRNRRAKQGGYKLHLVLRQELRQRVHDFGVVERVRLKCHVVHFHTLAFLVVIYMVFIFLVQDFTLLILRVQLRLLVAVIVILATNLPQNAAGALPGG